MLKQLLCSAALVTMAISASADSKVLWQSEDPAGKLVGWGDPALKLSAEEAESIKAGDYLTMTVTGVDPENGWPQVALFEGNVGWPPVMNEGVGGKEYPYVASFGVTPELADKIHANGIEFKGDGAYVSAIGLEEGTIAVGPNTVWFGPKACNWGDPVTISKDVFANVAPDDKIVVEYDKSAPEHTLQFIFGGWGGANIPSYEAWKTDFLTNDEEAGTYTIELKPSLTNLLWGEEGNQQEYDLFSLLQNNGLLMQGPCTVNQVLYIKKGLDYPDKIDFTLNGEKEIPGVTVTQEMIPYDGDDYLTIKISGKCAADEITLDITTPEGWDGLLVRSDYTGETEEIEPLKAKAPVKDDEDSWMPTWMAMYYGVTEGNTITFPVDGDEWGGMAFLVKGEDAYMVNIDFIFEVEPIVPAYPTSLDFTLNGNKGLEGVTVTQEKDVEGALKIDVTGECKSDNITLDFDVPEGWTGMLIMDAFGSGEIKQNISKVATETISLQNALNMGFKKGNEITYATDGENNYAQIALYKGKEVYLPFVDLTFEVAKEITNPAIPESIVVNTFARGLKVSQERDEDDGSIYVDITGTIAEEEFDVVLDVPEGWDGFVTKASSDGVTVGDHQGVNPRKIGAYDHDWVPLEDALADGYIKGDKLTFKASGNYEFAYTFLYKKDQVDFNAYIGITAKVNQGEPEDEPEFPDHLDYTLNGEKEIPGVTVRQQIDFETHVFSITGKCDLDEITVTFETPEGWDGLMIADTWGEGEISTVKTRSAELIPVEYILGQGFVEGNSITYKTDGEAQWGYIALIKGDMACSTFIDYDFTVSKSGNVPGPGDEPEFPESLVITTFPDEGLEVWQGEDQGVYSIGISGVIAEPTFTVVIDVPEGWDGFISIPYDENIVIGESGFNPRKTRAEDYYWEDIDEVLSWGAIKGNRFTFTPNGEEQDVLIYLYKGDQVEMVNWISLETLVSVDILAANQAAYDKVIEELNALQEKYDAAVAEIKEKNPDFDLSMYEEIPSMIEQTRLFAEQALNAANEEGVSFSNNFYGGTEEIDYFISDMLMQALPAPEFPTTFDVTLSSNVGVEMTTDDSLGVFVIEVTGKSAEQEITVTVAVPEGFDGVMHMSDLDWMGPGIEPLSTRADEPEWWPISTVLEGGMKEGNTMTFPVDGEHYAGQFFLCKHGMVDINNQINVEFEVEYDATVGVSDVDTTENAVYYDLQGNKIAKPAKGLYVKVVNGKATKVVVK